MFLGMPNICTLKNLISYLKLERNFEGVKLMIGMNDYPFLLLIPSAVTVIIIIKRFQRKNASSFSCQIMKSRANENFQFR